MKRTVDGHNFGCKITKDMMCQWSVAVNLGDKRMKLVDGFVAIEQIESTEVLSKLRLDPNLYEVVLKQNSIVLTHKPI